MRRIRRRAWALCYHVCFSVVQLPLLYAGKDLLHYLAHEVFLRASDTENKCPSCRFSDEACINKISIPERVTYFGGETRDFFNRSLKFMLLAVWSRRLWFSQPCSTPWWARVVVVLHGCRTAVTLMSLSSCFAVGVEGNLSASCAAQTRGYACVRTRYPMWVRSVADGQESMQFKSASVARGCIPLADQRSWRSRQQLSSGLCPLLHLIARSAWQAASCWQPPQWHLGAPAPATAPLGLSSACFGRCQIWSSVTQATRDRR